ncbi:hypothetical protein AA14337_3171 [Acetobacter malorum DSM 14337]|uniref:Uncharacterized protein n=1 Tax=Acetobacter malorum DSM 14337 TaxID=1307910 RepID=A0ABQ0Q026_9PROT|nr:hypothetical protein [Acetobacter malorum]KXV05751.1 hypothetical protein AD930_11545 [Acetobacter malorum]GBQ85831.1 hypothetical protein AA14337_3171 [Acetobacter malorum DSM 14337]
MVATVHVIPKHGIADYLKHMTHGHDPSLQEAPFSLDRVWVGQGESIRLGANCGEFEEFAICEVSALVPDTPGIPWVKVLRRGYKTREIAKANLTSHKASSPAFIIDIMSHSELEEIKFEGGIMTKSTR